MSEFCNDIENSVLDACLALGSLAATTSLKLHLHTADPTETGAVSEVVGGSYTPQTITLSAPEAGTGSNRKIENDAAIQFNGMPAAAVTHWTIKDNATTIWVRGAFASTINVSSGGDIDIAIDGITVELTGDWTATVMDGVLNALRGNAAFNPTTVKVTLSTADPGTGVIANEVAGITRQTISWNAASDGVRTNNGDITFPTVASATVSFGVLVRDSDGQVFWSDDIANQTGTDFRIKDTQMSTTVD